MTISYNRIAGQSVEHLAIVLVQLNPAAAPRLARRLRASRG